MLTQERQAEILKTHPDVTKVLMRPDPRASSITTNGETDIAPLLAHIGLVVTKTRRPRDESKLPQTLWPTWYQARQAPPGSQAVSNDVLLALICAKVLELTQEGGQPASMRHPYSCPRGSQYCADHPGRTQPLQ